MQDEQIGEINITELWHKNLFSSLMKIQEYERMSRDGANSIESYFNVRPSDVPMIQFNYLKQIATEMDILLVNANKKVKEKFFKDAQSKIKTAEQIIDNYPQKIIGFKVDQVTGAKRYFVTPLFWKILTELKDIRQELVIELTDILYGSNPDNNNKKKW